MRSDPSPWERAAGACVRVCVSVRRLCGVSVACGVGWDLTP